MISGLPSIVVIDDKKDELEIIKNAFFESGIPCLPIQYINNDPENESGIDHVDISDWVSPRVIVTDLNLTEMQGASPVNLAGPLVQMLKKLELSGPYLLCMWSKLERDVEGVMQVLEKRHKKDIVLPIKLAVISKTEFLTEENQLKEKVRNLISENALFEVLLNWESRISDAARRASNALYALAQENCEDHSIEAREAELRKILAAIGNQAIGEKHALETPGLAMDYGLIPVLEDQVRSMPENDLNIKWTNAVPEIGKNQQLDDLIKSKLNTFYHVEEVPQNYPKNRRGVFVSLNMTYLQDSGNMKKFEKRLGRKIKTIIHDEFLDSSQGNATEREAARKALTLGFLEISAACDHAQRKIKLPRYVLGVIIPTKFEQLTLFGHGNRNRSHGGIFRFPVVNINKEPSVIKLSFKYQFGAQPDDNKWFGPSVFRVREQILSDITFNNSQYTSRLGIVSFL